MASDRKRRSKFTQKADETAFFHTVIYPYRSEQPALDVEHLTVNDPYQLCSDRATALKITIRSEAEQYPIISLSRMNADRQYHLMTLSVEVRRCS